MRLHHYGFVGRDLATLQRRFGKECEQLTEATEDPVQRVVVQFYRDTVTGDVWEIVAPLTTVEESPLASRIGRGGGLDHVCYELELGDGTIEDAVAAARGQGAQVTCPPVYAAAFERRVAFVLFRSGRLIEYVEPRPVGRVV